jgi:alpha-ribazole phosphatase/probable phosphoglycerate mutase
MQQRGITIDAVYSSDLCRTVETAEILLQHSNIEITSTKELREINFGEWEGYTLEELHSNYPEQLSKWWQSPLTTRISGGESLADVVERVMPQVKNIIKNHREQNVLLASHGGVIRVIISSVLGINMNQYWRLHLDNCSLSVLYFPSGDIDQGVLELYNQTAVY